MKKIKSLIEKTVSLPTSVWIAIITVIAVVTFLLNTVFDVGCVAKAIFGVPCPVCGMTRAYLSLLTLDFDAAFKYNSSFWMFPLICVSGILAISDKKRKKQWIITFFSLLVIFIILWVIRLISETAI